MNYVLLPPEKKVCGKVIFLHVCHSVHGGGGVPDQVHSPRADTPPWADTAPWTEMVPQADTPWADTP